MSSAAAQTTTPPATPSFAPVWGCCASDWRSTMRRKRAKQPTSTLAFRMEPTGRYSSSALLLRVAPLCCRPSPSRRHGCKGRRSRRRLRYRRRRQPSSRASASRSNNPVWPGLSGLAKPRSSRSRSCCPWGVPVAFSAPPCNRDGRAMGAYGQRQGAGLHLHGNDACL